MIRWNPKLARLALLAGVIGGLVAAVGGYFEPFGCSW